MLEILPHELDFLKDKRNELSNKRLILAEQKNEAQGPSFDWHDNPGLDAVEDELAFNASEFNKLDKMIKDSKIIEYPTKDELFIKLGSLVIAKDEFGIMPLAMVGVNTVGAESYAKIWAEKGPEKYKAETLSLVTCASPIGKVAINATLGNIITYKVNDNEINVLISEIDQTWIPNNFSKIE